MVIPTEYIIISQVKNDGKDMMHVLLYYTEGGKSNMEWSHQMGLKTRKCKDISDYGICDHFIKHGVDVAWLFQQEIQLYLRLTMMDGMYDYSRQLIWSILEHSRSWELSERFHILLQCNRAITISVAINLQNVSKQSAHNCLQ